MKQTPEDIKKMKAEEVARAAKRAEEKEEELDQSYEIDEAKEAEWRREAEEILGHIGLTMDDAVRILIHQIVLRRGIPFEVKK